MEIIMENVEYFVPTHYRQIICDANLDMEDGCYLLGFREYKHMFIKIRATDFRVSFCIETRGKEPSKRKVKKLGELITTLVDMGFITSTELEIDPFEFN
jgi:hypothetical protein